jgi:hypothetical protein
MSVGSCCGGLELLDGGVDAADIHADRHGQRVLSGEVHAVVPSVAEKQGGLGLNRDLEILEDEVEGLRELVAWALRLVAGNPWFAVITDINGKLFESAACVQKD